MHFCRANPYVQQNWKNSRSDENTTPLLEKMQSGTVLEAAETLIAMQQTRNPAQPKTNLSGQITQKENVRPPLIEKIHIIENIKLN